MSLIEILFEKLAFITWDTIGNAFENKISYGEDTITSVNLLALKNASLPNLVIEDTRPSESVKGCDFEFWIGTHSIGWCRYAIQAKKITVSSESYKTLSHSVSGTPQIDILESYSSANKAIPLYCLFNYSKYAVRPSITCPLYRNIKELGCSVTLSSTIRRALAIRGARNFEWLHNRPETLPWSCLVRCSKFCESWAEELTGWKYEDAWYKELPVPLMHLFEKPLEQVEFVDSNLFSRKTPYRPRWVGVIDISNDEVQFQNHRDINI